MKLYQKTKIRKKSTGLQDYKTTRLQVFLMNNCRDASRRHAIKRIDTSQKTNTNPTKK